LKVSLDPKKIVAARKALGLTQQQVADLAGMKQQNYARIESGKQTDPRISTARRIAKSLQTTIEAICD